MENATQRCGTFRAKTLLRFERNKKNNNQIVADQKNK